jgi:hypothetical protein
MNVQVIGTRNIKERFFKRRRTKFIFFKTTNKRANIRFEKLLAYLISSFPFWRTESNTFTKIFFPVPFTKFSCQIYVSRLIKSSVYDPLYSLQPYSVDQPEVSYSYVRIQICSWHHNNLFPVEQNFSTISGFHHEVDEICALLQNYAAHSDNSLPTFRDNLSIPSSSLKNPRRMGRIGCPETSVKNCDYTLRNFAEERRSANCITSSATSSIQSYSTFSTYGLLFPTTPTLQIQF